MAQSRYLFATSCFQMDFLNEAEAALCPANEPSAEVLGRFLYVILRAHYVYIEMLPVLSKCLLLIIPTSLLLYIFL